MTDKTRLESAILPLLYWYAGAARDLPWRRDITPYHVWISEIMLQQTRVEAVIPYYHRFLSACPSIKALSEIEDDKLMKLWEGLGYYSRARNLKKAAGQIMEKHDGQLPSELDALLTLPGIGAYTAGAIASIAFGSPTPAVDGNVLRVITRLLLIKDDIALQRTKDRVKDLLSFVYPTDPPSASSLTQALMELGATVCIPNGEPRCEICPMRALCLAREEDMTDVIPFKSPKKPRRIEEKTVLLLKCGERYALVKRAQKGLLAGMWEPPTMQGHQTEGELLSLFSPIEAPIPLGTARHIFTHIEWDMIGYKLILKEAADGYLWKSAEEIREEYALPSAYRAYLKAL